MNGIVASNTTKGVFVTNNEKDQERRHQAITLLLVERCQIVTNHVKLVHPHIW
jgi:hypothetical protein